MNRQTIKPTCIELNLCNKMLLTKKKNINRPYQTMYMKLIILKKKNSIKKTLVKYKYGALSRGMLRILKLSFVRIEMPTVISTNYPFYNNIIKIVIIIIIIFI